MSYRRFVSTTITIVLVVMVAPAAALLLLPRTGDPSMTGISLYSPSGMIVGFAVLIRGIAVATGPSNPGVAARSRSRRLLVRSATVVVAVGVLTLGVGALLLAPPGLAVGVTLAFAGLALVAVRVVDLSARRSLRHDPFDVPKPGDDDLLGPDAVRHRVRRAVGLGAGAGVASAAGVLAWFSSRSGGTDVAAAGNAVLTGTLVGCAVAVTGTGAATRAATRRLLSITGGDQDLSRRISRAVARREIDELPPEDRALVGPWARASLTSVPAFLVLISGVVLVMAVGTVHQLLLADGWGLAPLALLGLAMGLLLLTMGARNVPRLRAAALADEDGVGP